MAVKKKTCARCCENKNVETEYWKSYSEVYSKYERLPICKTCLRDLYFMYLQEYKGDYQRAMYRICQLVDWYYNPDVVETCCREEPYDVRAFNNYASKMTAKQYSGRSFKSSLNVQFDKNTTGQVPQIQVQEEVEDPEYDEKLSKAIKMKTRKTFGEWYSDKDLLFLQDTYEEWIKRVGNPTKSEEDTIILLCQNWLDIMKARKDGKPTKDFEEAYRKNLEMGGWTPSKNKEEKNQDDDVLGALIGKFEENEPIEVDPEFEDVDKIGLLLNAFFVDPMGISLGVKKVKGTKLGKLLKERFTIHPPEKDDIEDLDSALDYLFSEDGD